MKILMINKFLYHCGGTETYIFKLGDYLKSIGHEVQYFGMSDDRNIVGNDVGAYTANMDFHNGPIISKLLYSIKTIYSREARIQIRRVLDEFKPDVCHINNFNYQLTPSIILEIKKWNKECRIVFTAHDYNLVCPNHMCCNPNTHENCEKCFGGHYLNCVKGKCIHGSIVKSIVGAFEGFFWNFKGIYKYLDVIVCCSEFLKSKIDSNPLFADKTMVMHNFIDVSEWKEVNKQEYILYFGRFSHEKGISTLIQVAKALPEYNFVFAGTGPLSDEIDKVQNIKNVGFQSGEALEKLIREARFSIYPSEWYENCPFSVMESQMYCTPVLGADIGGIPELIKVGQTGDLFKSGNKEELISKVKEVYAKANEYSLNCRNINFVNIENYTKKLLELYGGK